MATRLYVGDLPDLARKHDVIFKVTASTDTTRRKRLGNNGAIAYSRKFEMRSDSAAGYSATRLLSGVPVDQTMDLEIGLFELDGAAKRKYNSLTPLFLLIEDTPSGESIFSAPAGNAYVKLAMAAFNLVYNDMAKNDTILLNEFGMHIKPAVGILPIRPGQWIFLEEARKKDYRIDDPLQDLTFDGRRLSFAEGVSDKKMPTYIILSINLTPAPITAN